MHVLGTFGFVALVPTLAALPLANSTVGTQDDIVIASLYPKLLRRFFLLTFGTCLAIWQRAEYFVDASVEFLIGFCLPNAVRTYQKIAKTHQVFCGYSVIF